MYARFSSASFFRVSLFDHLILLRLLHSIIILLLWLPIRVPHISSCVSPMSEIGEWAEVSWGSQIADAVAVSVAAEVAGHEREGAVDWGGYGNGER